MFIAFEGGVLVTWETEVKQRYDLSNVPEVPTWSADSAYRESQFSRRFPLSSTGVRFSAQVAQNLSLEPGTQLYLHRFKMWGSFGYLLSTLSSTGGEPVQAWAEGRLHLDIEWLSPIPAHQSVIHVIGIPGAGLLVLPARSAIARPISVPVLPDLSGFTIRGRREQKVVVFRQGLRCVDIPGAVLHEAGFVVGDVLSIERIEGGQGLVIRKDPAGKQKVRYIGNSAAFRLGSTVLNWCGARDSVQSIACEGAIVVVDGTLGQDILEIPRQEGTCTYPTRTYPRPEGRLQLAGGWLKKQGFEPGMSYSMGFHPRGLTLTADLSGPYQVTAQNPGSGIPKVYVPGEFMDTLARGASEVGIIPKCHGQLLVVARKVVKPSVGRTLMHDLAEGRRTR